MTNQKMVVTVALVLIFLLPLFMSRRPEYNGQIDGHSFVFETAATEAARERGLGGRPSLGQDEGMLFTFDRAGNYCFWMKGMQFPIDILWFDNNQKLIYQKDAVAPESYPESFCPPSDAHYVVELPSGTAKKLQFSADATLELVKH
jgi:uncharacterized protein